MKTYVGPRGCGKTSLLINRALYAAHNNPSAKIYIVAPTTKKVAAIKKQIERSEQEVPKNIIFTGFETFKSERARGQRLKTPALFFFDDLDESLDTFVENAVGGSVSIEFVTATEDKK